MWAAFLGCRALVRKERGTKKQDGHEKAMTKQTAGLVEWWRARVDVDSVLRGGKGIKLGKRA